MQVKGLGFRREQQVRQKPQCGDFEHPGTHPKHRRIPLGPLQSSWGARSECGRVSWRLGRSGHTFQALGQQLSTPSSDLAYELSI